MAKSSPGATRTLGLHDDAFEQRRPNKGQITKREVRAVSLYSLRLHSGSVVWDIGAGTGLLGIEIQKLSKFEIHLKFQAHEKIDLFHNKYLILILDFLKYRKT